MNYDSETQTQKYHMKQGPQQIPTDRDSYPL